MLISAGIARGSPPPRQKPPRQDANLRRTFCVTLRSETSSRMTYSNSPRHDRRHSGNHCAPRGDVPRHGNARRLPRHGYGARAVARHGDADQGDYRAWLAITPEGEVVAGAGLVVSPWPPGQLTMDGRCACVFNVYTEPAHRRHGLARQLMTVIHDWSRAPRASSASSSTPAATATRSTGRWATRRSNSRCCA